MATILEICRKNSQFLENIRFHHFYSIVGLSPPPPKKGGKPVLLNGIMLQIRLKGQTGSSYTSFLSFLCCFSCSFDKKSQRKQWQNGVSQRVSIVTVAMARYSVNTNTDEF